MSLYTASRRVSACPSRRLGALVSAGSVEGWVAARRTFPLWACAGAACSSAARNRVPAAARRLGADNSTKMRGGLVAIDRNGNVGQLHVDLGLAHDARLALLFPR